MFARFQSVSFSNRWRPTGWPVRLGTVVLALVLTLVVTLALAGISGPLAAAEKAKGPVTGLPLPRFVSLKAGKVNVRNGPSLGHKIDWVYERAGMPVEVIAEHERWRRIRDRDGTVGWVFFRLLDGERTVIVESKTAGDLIDLRSDPEDGSATVARLEPGIIARLESCERDWCQINVRSYDGWIERRRLWGVYPDEEID